MGPDPFSILVESRKCRSLLIKGELVLEFHLPSTYIFAEKRLVRLFATAGLEEAVLVRLSFAALSPYNDSYDRLLAVAAPGSLPGPFVPVEGNFISSFSSITLAKANGGPFDKVPGENLVFSLQLVPDSQDGASGYSTA